MTGSLFSGDKLLQNTNYIDIQQAIQLNIASTNFNNISYINTGDSGVYLIYVEQIISHPSNYSSYIQSVVFDNIKTNTIAFGGFVEFNSTAGSSTFTVKNVNISNSVFDSPDSLIITQKYSYTGLA